MTIVRRATGLCCAFTLAGALVACGSDGSPVAGVATGTTGTKELSLVRPVRARIDALTDALRSGDLTASRLAYESYDAGWNGVEVYVNVRSRSLYALLETDLQARIADGLKPARPDLAPLVPLSEQLGRTFDEALALVQAGPALSPMFDDLAALRIVRADLRIATAALGTGDLNKARTSFAAFKEGLPGVEGLITSRSTSAGAELTAAVADADARFAQAGVTADDLKAPVATVTTRYNVAVNLWNAAARNADLAKTTFTDDDTKSLSALHDIETRVRVSQSSWSSGNLAGATEAAAAGNAAFEQVKPALAAKSADAALKSALDAYAAAAVAGGDAAKVAAAARAAQEAVAVAQQVIAGQFWTEPRLQQFLAGLPKA